MKKIKLEVVVEDKDARETLTFFQNLIIGNISFYVLCMEDCDG
jgi:hypothetical protein